MKNKTLNIVAFDVPYPPNYGGVIDIFYKIKSLVPRKVDVILHCFDYGRGRQEELEMYCKEVFYYRRKMSSILLLHSIPFIVVSRRDKRLVKNLLKNDHPILFEGLHSCFSFSDKRLQNRDKFIRAHNIEHDYYSGLAGSTNKLLLKTYYNKESKKLRSFEKIMADAKAVFSISPLEWKELSKRYSSVHLIMPFHGNDSLAEPGEREDFALYHGNLSVEENNKAALYLVNEVFRDLEYDLIILGNDPSKELIRAVSGFTNVELISGKSANEIQDYIKRCQINVLPTFQSTGIKLKLINALFNGGHCLVNKQMVEDTGLQDLCHIADNSESMRTLVMDLKPLVYSEKEKKRRERCLLEKLSDDANALQLIEHIFGTK